MAESRRQLINASSFFQREEGKFGGFSAKKSTISGSSFKKGSSLGNVVGEDPHRCLVPKASYFQSLLSYIYGTASRQN